MCKSIVAKGDLRFVTRAFVMPGRGTTFTRHVRCADAPFLRAVLAVHSDLDNVPVQGNKTELLSRVRDELRLSPSHGAEPGAEAQTSIQLPLS